MTNGETGIRQIVQKILVRMFEWRCCTPLLPAAAVAFLPTRQGRHPFGKIADQSLHHTGRVGLEQRQVAFRLTARGLCQIAHAPDDRGGGVPSFGPPTRWGPIPNPPPRAGIGLQFLRKLAAVRSRSAEYIVTV